MKKIKINDLEKRNLSRKEMSSLNGGATCMCGCKYAGTPGGSSYVDNGFANSERGYVSKDVPIEDQDPFITPAHT